VSRTRSPSCLAAPPGKQQLAGRKPFTCKDGDVIDLKLGIGLAHAGLAATQEDIARLATGGEEIALNSVCGLDGLLEPALTRLGRSAQCLLDRLRTAGNSDPSHVGARSGSIRGRALGA
jgi:hypothetical protein